MAFYGVPKIALAPLFIIWFGIGMWSKVALASIMVFFLVFYNVFSGVRSVDRELVNLTLVMGANQRQLTWHVYLPAAAPFVMLGMRLAIPYSVIGVIVGEFTSSTQGLGLFIHEASVDLRSGRRVRRHRHPAGVRDGRRTSSPAGWSAGCCAGERFRERPERNLSMHHSPPGERHAHDRAI